ncbi:PREDICTED: uncharacterized protein LOC109240901 [Nicotiana attenuata]|uniref:uncharacterized protein LOC109240901 n=1 Tax=Nicotiana attenuata TaxID=49451 RepID=UPI0009048C05|nr:PREDICTED: uncharacterized protein LOC109240901 [Nicotiana attenuata]
MDVIGPIEPATSNGHMYVLVAIDYFTKWVEGASYKAVIKKVVADFVRDRSVCRFGVPKSIITDNVANLNNDLMKDMCETFKIKHRNTTAYRPQMNGVVEAVRTSTRATPCLLVYNTEAVIRAEVEIPSLRIIQESELSGAEWIRNRYEQLALIDGKRMNMACHGQLSHNRIAMAFNKWIRSRRFTPGQWC